LRSANSNHIPGATTRIFFRDKSYRIPREIEHLILIITSDVEQFLDTLSVSPKECGGELCRHTISQPRSNEVSSFNKTLWLEALDRLEFHPNKSAPNSAYTPAEFSMGLSEPS
jgi:hypothetical protein